jgi:hypothetical protein
MAHAEHALAGFATDGEGLGQDLVERLALCDALLELGVLACSSASESACICGSRALIFLTRRRAG